jgi:hypothetical protein
VLDSVGAGALGAVVEMRAHHTLCGEREAPALVVEQLRPRVLAGHRA